MAINRPDFAEYCVVKSVFAGIWPPHILIALAQARSGIDDRSVDGRSGPFDFTPALWDAYRSDAQFEIDYQPQDIGIWPMQCTVAAVMVRRAMDRLRAAGKTVTLAAIYDEIWPPAAGVAGPALDRALADTATLVDPAVTAVLGPTSAGSDQLGSPTSGPGTSLIRTTPAGRPIVDYAAVHVRPDRQAFGDQILDAFIQAGFGPHHAVAALANAVDESGLDPKIHNGSGEDSWGLFQCNRAGGGLGAGHSPAELCTPDINIGIVIAAARGVKDFAAARSLENAVTAFVFGIEKPKDKAGAALARARTARLLLG
jgi:hypothetical protein